MTAIGSSIGLTNALLQRQLSAVGVVAAAANSGVRGGAAAGPATVLEVSALRARVAAINIDADRDGDARKALLADKIGDLIKSARALAKTALYTPSSLAAVTGSVTDLIVDGSIDVAEGTTISVGDGRTTATYVHVLGGRVQDFIDTVNGTAGLQVKASLTADRRIRLEATSTNVVAIGGTADADALAVIGLEAGATTGALDTVRQKLAHAFDAVRDEIDAVALAVGSGDDGSTVTAASLGIGPASVAPGGEFQSDAEIADILTDMEKAEKKLAELSAPFRSDASAHPQLAEFARGAVALLNLDESALLPGQYGTEQIRELARKTSAQLSATSLSLTQDAAATLRLFAL